MPNSHNILFFFCENVLPSNVRMFLFIPKVNYTEYSILIGFPRCLVVAMINVDFDLAKLEKPPWKGLWWTATLTKCFSRAGCRERPFESAPQGPQHSTDELPSSPVLDKTTVHEKPLRFQARACFCATAHVLLVEVYPSEIEAEVRGVEADSPKPFFFLYLFEPLQQRMGWLV